MIPLHYGVNCAYLELADYLIGASNSRKRSRGSTAVQPLDDDADEDACEK